MDIPLECENTDDCAFSIQMRDFTVHCKPDKFEVANVHCSGRYVEELFRINIFPNGRCNENKGYLSVMFVAIPKMLSLLNNGFIAFEFFCTASVIDANDEKRFGQSFAYVHELQDSYNLENLTFGFDKYLRTDTLLGSSSELLPSDSLTIYIEIIFRRRCLLADIYWHETLEKFLLKDGDKSYFRLDSVFGKILCQYSNVFRRLSEIPMIEKKTRRVYIVPEEYSAIQHILKFIVGASVRVALAEYIPILLEIYVVAEKYDIELVVKDCRLTIGSFFSSINDWLCLKHAVENVPNILELAEKYRDTSLRESAENFLEKKQDIVAHLREKMKIEPDTLKEQTVSCYIRRMTSSEQKPLLERRSTGCGEKPHLDFYT